MSLLNVVRKFIPQLMPIVQIAEQLARHAPEGRSPVPGRRDSIDVDSMPDVGRARTAHFDIVRHLNAQLSRSDVSEQKKASIRADLANIECAAVGQVTLDSESEAVLQQATRGLSGEEATVVRAKAIELFDEGYTATAKGREAFAATLAYELSEHIGFGTASEDLVKRAAELQVTGQSVIDAKPGMQDAMTANVLRGAVNADRRAAGQPIQF